MIWNRIRRHHAQVEMFRRTIRRGRLSHAYLFVGSEGIGKRTFARTLAQCLLCANCRDEDVDACGTCPSCRQMQAGTHSDFHAIGCPVDKKVLPIELIAGREEKRGREGLCFELSHRPTSGSRRIAVIDDADCMNEDSANALLKTLEEPPPYSLLILIAASPDSLLPTIRSRCQQVRFSPLEARDVAELVREHGIIEDPNEAEVVSRLSGGSVTTAAQLVDPALRKLREDLYDSLAAARFDSVGTAQRIVAALDGLGETQVQRQAAEWLMRFLVDYFSQALHHLAGEDSELRDARVKALAAAFEPPTEENLERLMTAIDRTALALDQVQRSAPVPLCLEGLLDDFTRIKGPVHVA